MGPNLYDAFQINSMGESRMVITDRKDQNFSDYATPWEKKWSKLCGVSFSTGAAVEAPEPFLPVVTEGADDGDYVAGRQTARRAGN